MMAGNGGRSDLLATMSRPLRTAWRRLTSMRTALILLFLLAVAAVPGSLLPQRPLNQAKTDDYITQHGGWGRFLDSIGMFDVFGSVWFAAIYLLLFVSLVGCLIPRIRVHARAVARKPLPAPRTLSRLPESARFEITDSPAAYVTAARAALGRRWRVEQRAEESGVLTLSAEKGYSRETGNLIFHVALLVSLVLVAVGRLYTYEGSVIVTQGSGFCNVASQFDSWKPGRLAAEGKVRPAPFCVDDLTKFTADYTKSGEPSQFRADVRYRPTLDSKTHDAKITVNHPLRLEGDRVYLINHGFAPSITVRMPDGTVQRDTQAFVPSNPSTFFSEGAYKEQGKGTDDDIGISAFFAPDPTLDSNGLIASASPRVTKPVLGIRVFEGNLNGNGTDQSVYSLDTSQMKRIGAKNLGIGQTAKLPNGVQVTFNGYLPTATLQVSHDPAQAYLLVAALAMVLGLIASLGVRRRRMWLRIRPATPHASDRDPAGAATSGIAGDPASDGHGESLTVVTVGGLARSDSGNFTTEFAGLVERLTNAGNGVRDTDRISRPMALGPAGGKD